MSRWAVSLIALCALTACSPAPRAVRYFKAHPEETGRVLAECATGFHRGTDCSNAQTARAQSDSDARMAAYKKAF